MKPCGVVAEQPSGAADQRHIEHQHHDRMPDHEIGGAGIAMRQPVEAAIEHAGESVPAARDEIPARRRPLVLMRLQDQRGQRRRQRQRTEAGNRGRDRNGDGELLEELPGDAAEERGRHEHRAQHQRDRHQRAADLFHGACSAASRRLMPCSRCRSTFSTTTMASSTTMPTASTRPNSVRLLIEKPSAAITAKVPTSDTGIAMIGMIAGRQPCRNTSTTMTTSTIAS